MADSKPLYEDPPYVGHEDDGGAMFCMCDSVTAAERAKIPAEEFCARCPMHPHRPKPTHQADKDKQT